MAISLALLAACIVVASFFRGVYAIRVMEAMYPNRAEGRFTFVLMAVTLGQVVFGGLAITLDAAALLLHWRNKWVWPLALLTLLLAIVTTKMLHVRFERAMSIHGYVEMD